MMAASSFSPSPARRGGAVGYGAASSGLRVNAYCTVCRGCATAGGGADAAGAGRAAAPGHTYAQVALYGAEGGIPQPAYVDVDDIDALCAHVESLLFRHGRPVFHCSTACAATAAAACRGGGDGGGRGDGGGGSGGGGGMEDDDAVRHACAALAALPTLTGLDAASLRACRDSAARPAAYRDVRLARLMALLALSHALAGRSADATAMAGEVTSRLNDLLAHVLLPPEGDATPFTGVDDDDAPRDGTGSSSAASLRERRRQAHVAAPAAGLPHRLPIGVDDTYSAYASALAAATALRLAGARVPPLPPADGDSHDGMVSDALDVARRLLDVLADEPSLRRAVTADTQQAALLGALLLYEAACGATAHAAPGDLTPVTLHLRAAAALRDAGRHAALAPAMYYHAALLLLGGRFATPPRCDGMPAAPTDEHAALARLAASAGVSLPGGPPHDGYTPLQTAGVRSQIAAALLARALSMTSSAAAPPARSPLASPRSPATPALSPALASTSVGIGLARHAALARTLLLSLVATFEVALPPPAPPSCIASALASTLLRVGQPAEATGVALLLEAADIAVVVHGHGAARLPALTLADVLLAATTTLQALEGEAQALAADALAAAAAPATSIRGAALDFESRVAGPARLAGLEATLLALLPLLDAAAAAVAARDGVGSSEVADFQDGGGAGHPLAAGDAGYRPLATTLLRRRLPAADTPGDVQVEDGLAPGPNWEDGDAPAVVQRLTVPLRLLFAVTIRVLEALGDAAALGGATRVAQRWYLWAFAAAEQLWHGRLGVLRNAGYDAGALLLSPPVAVSPAVSVSAPCRLLDKAVRACLAVGDAAGVLRLALYGLLAGASRRRGSADDALATPPLPSSAARLLVACKFVEQREGGTCVPTRATLTLLERHLFAPWPVALPATPLATAAATAAAAAAAPAAAPSAVPAPHPDAHERTPPRVTGGGGGGGGGIPRDGSGATAAAFLPATAARLVAPPATPAPPGAPPLASGATPASPGLLVLAPPAVRGDTAPSPRSEGGTAAGWVAPGTGAGDAAAVAAAAETARVAAGWLQSEWDGAAAPFPGALLLAQVGAALLELEADAWLSIDGGAAPVCEECFEALGAHLWDGGDTPPAAPAVATAGPSWSWPVRVVAGGVGDGMDTALAFALPPLPTFGLAAADRLGAAAAAASAAAPAAGDGVGGLDAAALMQALRRGGARLAAGSSDGVAVAPPSALRALLAARLRLLYGFAVARRLHGRRAGTLLHVTLPDAGETGSTLLATRLPSADGALPFVPLPTVVPGAGSGWPPGRAGATGVAWSASALASSPAGAGASTPTAAAGIDSPRLLATPLRAAASTPSAAVTTSPPTLRSPGARSGKLGGGGGGSRGGGGEVGAWRPATDACLPTAVSRASRAVTTLLRAAAAADTASRTAAGGAEPGGIDQDVPAASESRDMEVGIPLSSLLARMLPRT